MVFLKIRFGFDLVWFISRIRKIYCAKGAENVSFLITLISMPYDCQDQLYEIGLSLLHLQTMYVHLVC